MPLKGNILKTGDYIETYGQEINTGQKYYDPTWPNTLNLLQETKSQTKYW